MPNVTILKRAYVKGKIVEPDQVVSVDQDLAKELIENEVASYAKQPKQTDEQPK